MSKKNGIYRKNLIFNIHTENDEISTKNTISDQTRIRLHIVVGVILVAYFIILFRLVDLSIMSDEKNARGNSIFEENHLVTRGIIYDRNGLVLATNLPTQSLYVKPEQIDDVKKTSKALAGVIQKYSEQTNKSFAEKIASKIQSGKNFVWIKRHLIPEEHSKIKALGIPGVYFTDDSKRFYPHENNFAHVVGFVDIDQKGIAGVEKYFDKTLSEGNDLYLSLDSRVQAIVHTKLNDSILSNEALGGMAVIMNAKNGEIVSLVSLPDYNPNGLRLNNYNQEVMFNRASLGVYEMGSTFKILTMAIALDMGVVKLSDSFNVVNPIKLGKYKINDYRFHKANLSLTEVLVFSSNRGAIQIGNRIGAAKQQEYMDKTGILSPVHVEVNEVGKPIYSRQWSDVYLSTVSYGHGIAVTALNTAQAIAAVVNGGILYKPTLLKHKNEAEGIRVFKPSTSKIMRSIMRLVVEEGYGKKADVEGYNVGGKTGTAEKVKNGKYVKRDCNLVLFIGAFPIDDPDYIIVVAVDEPKPNKVNSGFTTGGMIAAPLAGKIIESTGQLLHVHQKKGCIFAN